MNRITDDFKKGLAARYSQQREGEPILPPSTQQRQIPNSEQKFMQLFESINRAPQPQNTSLSPPKTHLNQERFATTIAEYSSAPSFMDSVLGLGEDALPVGYTPLPLVEPPILLNQKMPFEQAIRNIGFAFEGQEYISHAEMVAEQFMDVEAYSTVLAALGRRNKVADAKAMAKGKAVIREPSLPPVRSLRQIQTDTAELEEQQREQSERMKKIDLILVELITEKKRKNYMVDYEASMEMKLMELLQFILQDEPEYAGLDPATKTRQVLRNLQSFQGKTIEGESKINLLRIFFQEFTALKKEREEHFSTPMKKVENREKPSKTRPQTKKTVAKPEVLSHQENSLMEKKSTKSKQNQQAEKRDEWMGSLS